MDDWWLRKIKKEATFGHRYFCVMVLAIYAKKCNVSKKELEEDAYSLIPLFSGIKLDDPFTKEDVQNALESYNENYVTFPRADIEKITAIDIPKNKRNYRTQEMHLKGARAIQEINNPDWREGNGRPSKEKKVKEYLKNNPDKNVTDISKALKVSRTTVYKYI